MVRPQRSAAFPFQDATSHTRAHDSGSEHDVLSLPRAVMNRGRAGGSRGGLVACLVFNERSEMLSMLHSRPHSSSEPSQITAAPSSSPPRVRSHCFRPPAVVSVRVAPAWPPAAAAQLSQRQGAQGPCRRWPGGGRACSWNAAAGYGLATLQAPPAASMHAATGLGPTLERHVPRTARTVPRAVLVSAGRP